MRIMMMYKSLDLATVLHISQLCSKILVFFKMASRSFSEDTLNYNIIQYSFLMQMVS